MRRWLWIALGAVAVVVFGGIALVATIDFEQFARARLGLVEQATGRPLKIGGELSVRLLPRIVLVAEDLSFANAKWGSQPDMLRVKRIEAALAILPLLRRQVEISRLVLVEPQLLLETDASGNGNWVLEPKKGATASSEASEGGRFGISAPSIVVERGRVTFRDRKETLQFAIDRLALTATAGVERVELKAALREQPFSVQGTVGSIGRLIDKEKWPIDLALSMPGTELKFAGDVDRSAQRAVVSGKLDAEVRDFSALSKFAGANIDLPTPATLQATLAAAADQQRIEPLVLRFGKTAIEGSAAIRTSGAKPRISARLASPELDLARPAGKEGPKAAATSDPRRVFSDAKLPFAALNQVDGDFDLRVDRLRLPDGVQLVNLRARAALANGRLLVEPISTGVAQGTVSGRVEMQPAPTPRTALRLDARQVSLSTLAAQLGKSGKSSGGATDASVDLVLTGDSMRAMAAGASGTIRISVGPAQLAGELPFGDFATALLAAVSPGRKLESGTRVECAVAVLPLQAGVARVDRSIAFETSKLDITASGTIDLRS